MIRIFQNSKILINENYIVDDIEDYLSTLSSLSFSSTMYVRHGLEINIKIQLSKGLNLFGVNSYAYNYCAIQNNEDTYPIYYFITNKSELSDGAVSLSLKMDTINSFTTTRGSFVISDRTLITRQHKNRFIKETPYGEDAYIRAHIDAYSEGINPKLFKKRYADVAETSGCYLMYKNAEYNSTDTNQGAINCFLVLDVVRKVNYDVGNTLGAPGTPFGNMFVMFGDTCPNITLDGNNETLTSHQVITASRYASGFYVIKRTYPSTSAASAPYDDKGYETLEPLGTFQNIIIPQGSYYYSNPAYGLLPSRNSLYVNSTRIISQVSQVAEATLYNLDQIDRTDSRILKIIKLPALPTDDLDYSTAYLTYSSSKWKYNKDENLLQLLDLNTDFYRTDAGHVRLIDLNPAISMNLINTNATYTQAKNIAYEPKLYHSEFYYAKAMYDSFTKVIKNEAYLDYYESNESTYAQFAFKMTTTINSRFFWKFSFFSPNEFTDEDYPEYLIIQRNNEMAIYNSPYLNYIRAGYNYDVKNKNRQEGFSWFTTGLGLIAGAASVAFGSKTLGAGLIASSVLSITNAINTTAQLETNMDSKLEQLRWQGNSVYGADDIDLLESYCSNLKFPIYECSDRMKNLIYNLFFYTGYIENTMGIPATNTRIWFNFLSCEIKFSEVRNIPDECLDDIIDRYQGGVTFFHDNIVNGVKTWDFERQYENWETLFFE